MILTREWGKDVKWWKRNITTDDMALVVVLENIKTAWKIINFGMCSKLMMACSRHGKWVFSTQDTHWNVKRGKSTMTNHINHENHSLYVLWHSCHPAAFEEHHFHVKIDHLTPFSITRFDPLPLSLFLKLSNGSELLDAVLCSYRLSLRFKPHFHYLETFCLVQISIGKWFLFVCVGW